MDETEAGRLLRAWVQELRRRSYGDLRDTYLREPECHEVRGDSGTVYQAETDSFWDGRKGGDLRVVASIDDGRGWRAFCPLTEDFIIAHDGSFVGE